MIRIYVKTDSTRRQKKFDDVAKMQYIEIDVHPLAPIPICWDGIQPDNVLFVTFYQKFTGDMQRGLYRSGRKNRLCEAHVTGGDAPDDRQVRLKAPTFDLVKRMWTRMCTGDLKPYKKM